MTMPCRSASRALPALPATPPALLAAGLILALGALAAGLAGCGPDGPGLADSEVDEATLAAGDAAVGFPRRIVLPGGGELLLEAAPQRLVPASSAAVDLLLALVPPERLAGLPGQALDFSALADRGPEDTDALTRPRFKVYAAEPLLALDPDLVLADGWQLADTTQRLREAGVPVLELRALESLDDVRATLLLLGSICDEQPRARAVVADLDARVEALARTADRRAGATVLAYSNGGSGGWLAGAGTCADEWIRLAGLRNAAADRVGHQRCSFEELLVLDPDLIVVSGPSSYDGKGATERLLREEPALAGLRALAGGRIIALPAWLYDTVSQNMVTAAEALARGADAALAAP
jgi:iron complex transport system substrate-binding protein